MKKLLIIISLVFFPSFVFAQTFDHNLYFGMRHNSDVTQLQDFLTSIGLYNGPITGNFFFLTLKAVKAYQAQEGISPAAGFVGPITRAKLNQAAANAVNQSNQQAIKETGTTTPTINQNAQGQVQQPTNAVHPNTTFCNGVYYTPCPTGSDLVCPGGGGSAYCQSSTSTPQAPQQTQQPIQQQTERQILVSLHPNWSATDYDNYSHRNDPYTPEPLSNWWYDQLNGEFYINFPTVGGAGIFRSLSTGQLVTTLQVSSSLAKQCGLDVKEAQISGNYPTQITHSANFDFSCIAVNAKKIIVPNGNYDYKFLYWTVLNPTISVIASVPTPITPTSTPITIPKLTVSSISCGAGFCVPYSSSPTYHAASTADNIAMFSFTANPIRDITVKSVSIKISGSKLANLTNLKLMSANSNMTWGYTPQNGITISSTDSGTSSIVFYPNYIISAGATVEMQVRTDSTQLTLSNFSTTGSVLQVSIDNINWSYGTNNNLSVDGLPIIGPTIRY